MVGWTGFPSTRRVGGFAADAVMVGRKIIRHDIGAGIDHRVGGIAANPTSTTPGA